MRKDSIRPKTIFCDIDGTLIEHLKTPLKMYHPDVTPRMLPGVLERLLEWDLKGYNLILVTGRRESMRETTIKQLSKLAITYDQLIMGIGGGERVLINDAKPNSVDQTCSAITIVRNDGIASVNI